MNAENMYDAWDNGDRHEIRQQFARREEIIRMAREAGLLNCDCCLPFWEEDDQENWKRFFVNFATLIAAAERDACAKVCEQQLSTHGWAQACLAASAIRKRSNT